MQRLLSVDRALDRGFEVGMFQHRQELHDFLMWVVTQKGCLSHVLEIGALHGGTAMLFSELSLGKVISVDLPNGRFGGADHHLSPERCAERNAKLERLNGGFVGILGNSHDPMTAHRVREALLGERVDLLFIDGDHTYEGVKQDYEMYREFVAPGGIIAFHDVNDTVFHRDAGCEVPRFWQELPGDKHVFTVNAPWGGIGAVCV